MINVYVNQNGRNGQLVGTFEDVNEAVISLTESRGDKDYSMTTFKDCYKVEDIEEE